MLFGTVHPSAQAFPRSILNPELEAWRQAPPLIGHRNFQRWFDQGISAGCAMSFLGNSISSPFQGLSVARTRALLGAAFNPVAEQPPIPGMRIQILPGNQLEGSACSGTGRCRCQVAIELFLWRAIPSTGAGMALTPAGGNRGRLYQLFPHPFQEHLWVLNFGIQVASAQQSGYRSWGRMTLWPWSVR